MQQSTAPESSVPSPEPVMAQPSSTAAPAAVPPSPPAATAVSSKNGLSPIVLVLGGLLLLLLGSVGGYLYALQTQTVAESPVPSPAQPNQIEPEGVMCTLEAKICPDGSAVGRTGPNCEFEACPGGNAVEQGQVLSNEELGFSITLPADWPEVEMRTEGDIASIVLPLWKPAHIASEKEVFLILKDYEIPDTPGPYYQEVLFDNGTNSYVFRESNEGIEGTESDEHPDLERIPEGEELFSVVKGGFELMWRE